MLKASFQKIIFLSLFTLAPLYSTHKIVYLISPPRSLSVAFMRMIQARGDFTIFHEPSQYVYCKNEAVTVLNWFNNDAPSTYEAVKQEIFKAAEFNDVFVKEMSFAIYRDLVQDQNCVSDPRIYFIFLIRNPHHSIISFYQHQQAMQVPTPRLDDIVGYKACYEIFNYVRKNAVHQPLVIYSEDLYTNPQETIERFCKHVDIPFKEEALSWQDLGTEFNGQQEWHEIKKATVTHTWHSDAIRSTGFGQPTQYQVDADNNPTFIEISNLEHRAACKKAYQQNKIYYDLMRNAEHHFVYGPTPEQVTLIKSLSEN